MKRIAMLLVLAACGGRSGGGIESSVLKVDNAAGKALPSPAPSGPCSASDEGVVEPGEAEGKSVRVITICGVSEKMKPDVLSYLRMKPGHLYRGENLASDVRGLFDSGFFHRIDVVTRGTKSGALDVEFHLEMFPLVRDVAIEGAPNLAADDDIHKELKVGSVISRYALQRAGTQLRERYVKAGFEEAKVTVSMTPPAGEGGGRVLVRVEEGTQTKIGVVKIAGVPKDIEVELRKIEHLAPGTPLSDYALLLARTAVGGWFNAHGYLEANGKLERGARAPDGSAPIDIEMSEGPRYKIGVIKISTGDATLDGALKKEVRVRAGDHFDRDKMRDDVDRMNELLRARGRKELVAVDVQEQPKKRTIDFVFSVTRQ